MWQVFMGSRKAYDSILQRSLYKVVYEFGFQCKLMFRTKLCKKDTKYKVRMGHTLSEEFRVVTGLKQSHPLSSFPFNIALKQILRSEQ